MVVCLFSGTKRQVILASVGLLTDERRRDEK